MKKILQKLQNKQGEGYLDTVVLVIVSVLVIALAVHVLPIFSAKIQLDNFADELIREAEIAGRIGSETSQKEQSLREKTGLSPSVTWSKSGNVQLNEEVTVILTMDKDIGLFGTFGSYPVHLQAKATGKSEVYHR